MRLAQDPDVKEIGAKLAKLAEASRTGGDYEEIGLYMALECS
jgi:hypothetical protein